MLRSIVVTSTIISAAFLFACNGSAVVGESRTGTQQLQKKKDGTPTGNGTTCSWAGTAAYDTTVASNAGVSAPPNVGSTPTDPTTPGGGIACPELARICKDGSLAKHALDSCDLLCPEDPTPAPAPDTGSPPSPGTGPTPGGVPNIPIPTYGLGDEFKSIDGCNECECTDKGIMCTVKACDAPLPTPCPAIAIQCADGSTGKQGPNCELYCPEDGTVISCTKDAKKCDDGSYVPRIAPNCEFAACPTSGGNCGAPALLCPDGTAIQPGPGCAYPECPTGGNVCPADAKRCPDGSFVSRSGPNCTFPACGGTVTPTSCDPKDCGPAPGAPNYTCPDNKTIGGPACQRAPGTNKCAWISVECP